MRPGSRIEFTSMAERDRGVGYEQAARLRANLRVVVLDSVYRHARAMFRHLHKRAEAAGHAPPVHVALHPRTLSVYKRAQNGYAQASAASVANLLLSLNIHSQQAWPRTVVDKALRR